MSFFHNKNVKNIVREKPESMRAHSEYHLGQEIISGMCRQMNEVPEIVFISFYLTGRFK